MNAALFGSLAQSKIQLKMALCSLSMLSYCNNQAQFGTRRLHQSVRYIKHLEHHSHQFPVLESCNKAQYFVTIIFKECYACTCGHAAV